jgi:hypothetical protein
MPLEMIPNVLTAAFLGVCVLVGDILVTRRKPLAGD